MPISTRKASASILVVGYAAMKPATGPEATYITSMAITIAAIMISMSCAMPIAVMMESSEKTRSTTISCATTRSSAARGEAVLACWSPSRASTSA